MTDRRRDRWEKADISARLITAVLGAVLVPLFVYLYGTHVTAAQRNIDMARLATDKQTHVDQRAADSGTQARQFQAVLAMDVVRSLATSDTAAQRRALLMAQYLVDDQSQLPPSFKRVVSQLARSLSGAPHGPLQQLAATVARTIDTPRSEVGAWILIGSLSRRTGAWIGQRLFGAARLRIGDILYGDGSLLQSQRPGVEAGHIMPSVPSAIRQALPTEELRILEVDTLIAAAGTAEVWARVATQYTKNWGK